MLTIMEWCRVLVLVDGKCSSICQFIEPLTSLLAQKQQPWIYIMAWIWNVEVWGRGCLLEITSYNMPLFRIRVHKLLLLPALKGYMLLFTVIQLPFKNTLFPLKRLGDERRTGFPCEEITTGSHNLKYKRHLVYWY